METARTVEELRARVGAWRAAGETVALVPTMGALHEGHVALVRRAKARARRTVATIFVNPRQFGPAEDLARYPRPFERDRALLAQEGADLLFAPPPEVVYPPGFATAVKVRGLSDLLEGEHRPGFFEGVATVVAKLLAMALPDVALFGEKDYQQLLVIERLASDLDLPVAIEGVPTVREADGLALSSRNAYLDGGQRAIATALHRALLGVARAVAAGAEAEIAAGRAAADVLKAGFARIDYLTVRDARTLETWQLGRPGRVLAAAWLGTTRLIDNVPVP